MHGMWRGPLLLVGFSYHRLWRSKAQYQSRNPGLVDPRHFDKSITSQQPVLSLSSLHLYTVCPLPLSSKESDADNPLFPMLEWRRNIKKLTSEICFYCLNQYNVYQMQHYDETSVGKSLCILCLKFTPGSQNISRGKGDSFDCFQFEKSSDPSMSSKDVQATSLNFPVESISFWSRYEALSSSHLGSLDDLQLPFGSVRRNVGFVS